MKIILLCSEKHVAAFINERHVGGESPELFTLVDEDHGAY